MPPFATSYINARTSTTHISHAVEMVQRWYSCVRMCVLVLVRARVCVLCGDCKTHWGTEREREKVSRQCARKNVYPSGMLSASTRHHIFTNTKIDIYRGVEEFLLSRVLCTMCTLYSVHPLKRMQRDRIWMYLQYLEIIHMCVRSMRARCQRNTNT